MPTPPTSKKPRKDPDDSTDTNMSESSAATKPAPSQGSAPGRADNARSAEPPQPVDSPDSDRFGKRDLSEDDEEVSFTASDSDLNTPDTDEQKDTDEGTDGTPVLA
jgi:hypothetical protein